MANIIAKRGTTYPRSETNDDLHDPLTHLRIGNRLIGKEVINIQMKGREFYSIESLNNNDASRFHLEENDWVTGGVVHRIMHTRSQGGRVVNFFQITDLKDSYVNVFLGGDFTPYASIPVGGVVLLINPSILPSKDGKNKIALAVKSLQYIKFVGKALDYGVCHGIQRNGIKCSNAVNLEVSKYCMYHIRVTQEEISALRSDINSESLQRNVVSNNLSEGRFHIGKEVIDCRGTDTTNHIDLSTLQYYRTKGKGGMYGGYIASRMKEKAEEEMKKKKQEEERMEMLKRRREMESKENSDKPFLGRGMLPGKVIRLSDEDERLSKMYQLKERLERTKKAEETKAEKVPLKTTGNVVFDSLLQSTKDTSKMKETVLNKESAYSDKARQDKLRILKEKEEMLERKHQARMEMTSMEITCYWCANCQKFVENGIGKQFCENQGHFLERRREQKRMFECQECHSRTSFIGIENPVSRCACGGYVWKPCSFYKERDVKMEELRITAPNTHVLYCHSITNSTFCIC